MTTEENQTGQTPKSRASIPLGIWIAGVVTFVAILGIVVMIIIGGSSNKMPEPTEKEDETPGLTENTEEEDETPGLTENTEEGDEEPQQANIYKFTGVDRVLVTNNAYPLIEKLVSITMPSDVSEVQKLSLQFERDQLTTEMDQAILDTGYNYRYNFEYLVYHIKQDADEESVDSFVDCEDEEWQEIYDLGQKRPGECADKILYDLSGQPEYDYKYKSLQMTIDRSTDHGTAILEKLRANHTLEVFLRITGFGTSGEITSVRGEIAYY